MRQIKLLVLIMALFSVMGATCTKKPTPTVDRVEIQKNYVPVEILHPPLPEAISWEEFEWVVLTPQILRKMLKEYDDGKLPEKELVFFGITPEGYEHLSVNMADIIRYIEGQKSVIMYYKNTIPKEVFLPAENNDN
jgi:hypothetical protein